MLWFTEDWTDTYGLRLGIENAQKTRTPFQEITVAMSKDFGKVLALDGLVQLTEKDEFIYHEMISHVPLFTLGRDIENVLIIGGGDGGTAREVLKHNPKSIDVVEIDREVVEFAKREFPKTSSSFSDDRVNLIFDDGREFVKDKEDIYDVVIVDCSDPVGPSKVLYEEGFYADVYKALREDGILTTQSESPWVHRQTFINIVSNLKKVFPIVMPYLAFIPSYPSGMWSFTLGSKIKNPLEIDPQELSNRMSKVAENVDFKYYNLEVHFGSFAIPSFVFREEV